MEREIERLQEEIRRLRRENEELGSTKNNLCILRDKLSEAIAKIYAQDVVEGAQGDRKALDTTYSEMEEWLLYLYFSDQDSESVESFKRTFERATLNLTGHIGKLRSWRPERLYGTDPEISADLKLKTRLLDVLDQRFSEEELKTLCFLCDVDYDNLPAEGKKNKARELITYFDRRNRIPDLVNMVEDKRPDSLGRLAPNEGDPTR